MRVSQLVIGLTGLVGIAIAAPHDGMIDLPGYRDVGIVFDEASFGGTSKYLIQNKNKAECLPIEAGKGRVGSPVDIASVQVCYPQVSCALFAAADCSTEGYVLNIVGPHDANSMPELPEGVEPTFKSYLCGDAGSVSVTADLTLEANVEHAQHQPNADGSLDWEKMNH